MPIVIGVKIRLYGGISPIILSEDEQFWVYANVTKTTIILSQQWEQLTFSRSHRINQSPNHSYIRLLSNPYTHFQNQTERLHI